jgi:phosphatidate phosphatase APP1
LALFLQSTGFPPASSFSLKSIRLKDRSVLTLFADPMVSKLAKISSLLETYPRRTFVLVGDTGERDPEVYGEICRQYPNQVERVFLRDVIGGLSEEVLQTLKVKQEKKKRGIVLNAPDRLEKAFDGVSPETWSVFTNVKEINY